MTEQELLEKIVEVIEKTEFVTGCYPKNIVNIKQRTTYDLHSSFTNFVTTISFDFACVLADALIAAGIGDVKEAEHRAARAERALLTACAKMVKDEKDDVNIELLVGVIYRKYLKQAEKELQEEMKDE